ncbi:type II toxin-antitoxin system HicA family toxin [Fibrella sp. HMF5335]|uniref:Type II toxin-antitoxin system HicA family toxin n=1 Tax=Fibrella rubiginis TaxID=2817060 RepID=A0A939K3R2_9BACT|nr:type II toxin-antitoxin system HicA family toxin [Fibrella rubiginis]MBO0937644.1 type II toxin-antitoxin system HicA family toxin [Fibrella rubiginis]
MKTPRDVSGKDLIKLLKPFGYELVSQNGSHIKVTTEQNGQHYIAVPNHDPVKIGILNGILSEVARHFGFTKEYVARTLFG